jgi:hypothetical protein
MATTPAGNQTAANFFSNAIRNRAAMVPGAVYLATFANKGQLGAGAAVAYNAKVRASQQNGSGPAVAPITAPFSFGSFATGIRTLVRKRTTGK